MPFDKDGIWKPESIPQEQFLALPESIPEALLGGGVNTGKSEILMLYGVVRKYHLIPGFKQVYLRKQLNQIRNEIVPRSKLIFKKLKGWNYNASYMYWEYIETGAQIFLGHCENEDDVHNYDTMEINLFTPDELTSLTEWSYLYIALQRVRSRPNSGLPAITRAAGMPGDIGHTWVKKRFVDAAPEGGKLIIGKGNRKMVYIHTTVADMPDTAERKEYSIQLDALPEAERQAKKFGKWDSYAGQVFNEWRDRNYPDEPDNAIHWIEPFDIPEFWPKIFVLDWGYAAMCYLLKIAISPKRRVYAYGEQWWRRTKISEWAPYVLEEENSDHPRSFVVCRSAKQDRGQEQTIQQQIEEALGHSVELANHSKGSRIAGKLLIHEYLRWKQKHIPTSERSQFDEERALHIFRNRGLDEYNSYLKSFLEPEPEKNLPKLQVFNTCVQLKDALTACVADKDVPEDVAEFDGDDPYDTLRYALDRVSRYFDEAKTEFERIEQREEIIRKFEQNQDWNILYRNAQKIDNSSVVHPIRRYSGRPRFH